MAFEATFYAFFNIQTMQYSFLDFLTLIGAVGLFLYGMKVMSEGLQKVAGDRLRSIMSAMTKNRFAGLITGILITATKVSLYSKGGVVIDTEYKSDENVRIGFVINKSSGSTYQKLSFIYANGIISRCESWAVTDSYTSSK